MLGKSFINSGQTIPKELVSDDVKTQLPEGINLNSPEADEFFANELQNEIEKVMLVSSRIEGVAFIPSEFDQLSPGLGNIKVPIINNETGDVVFLGMGDINFQPEFSGLEGEDNSNQSSSPERLTLKGQEGIAIDLGSGEFFEQKIDPQIKAVKVIEVAALKSLLGNALEINILSNEEFLKTRKSFLFNSQDYANSWIKAVSQGLVPVFDLDGSVDYLSEEEAVIAQRRINLVESGANEILSISEKEVSFEDSLNQFLDLTYGELFIPETASNNEINNYAIGTTTYSDLNDRSSGTDTYTGAAQNLYVDQVASGSASVGDVAGSFTPKHIIDYSNRTVTQQISNGTVSIGSISNQAFAINKEHSYNSNTTGNVTPAFVVRKGASGSKRLGDSITGDITTTVPATGYTDSTGDVYITLESEFTNSSGKSFADNVNTTITIQTRDTANGSINKVSGTSSDGRD
jgi:hypothetical protein